jgi:hypothetical protein
MTMAIKLEVTTSDREKVYETGKDNVILIEINKKDRIIEIKHVGGSKWDYTLIPFEEIKSFKFKEKKFKEPIP